MYREFFNRLDASPARMGLFLACLSFLIIVVFSPWTSILTPYFCFDSGVYALIGKAWWMTNLIPYRDLFDHKGPFVYSFYALAAAFGNLKWGLTVLQTLWLSVGLFLGYRVARLYTTPIRAWVVLALFAIVFVLHIGEGGNTEEISLPFSLLSLYIFLKHQRSDFSFPQGKSGAFIDFLIIGACIGVNFMIRPNNAVVSCCCCMILAAYLSVQHRWKHLFYITLTCCLGCIIICLPYMVYFHLHSALEDYWYSNFVYNMKYAASGKGGILGVIRQFVAFPYLLLVPVCIWGNCRWKVCKTWEMVLLAVMAVASFAIACMGKRWDHYLLLCLPAHVCLCSLSLRLLDEWKCRNKRRIQILAILSLMLLSVGSTLATTLGMNLRTSVGYLMLRTCHCVPFPAWNAPQRGYQEATELAHCIPCEERGDFLSWNMFGGEYLYMGTVPCCPYFILQERMVENGGDAEMRDKIANAISKSSPKWLLTAHSVSLPFPMECYELKASTTHYQLYRLKE